jgi:hypothetical protein
MDRFISAVRAACITYRSPLATFAPAARSANGVCAASVEEPRSVCSSAQ